MKLFLFAAIVGFASLVLSCQPTMHNDGIWNISKDYYLVVTSSNGVSVSTMERGSFVSYPVIEPKVYRIGVVNKGEVHVILGEAVSVGINDQSPVTLGGYFVIDINKDIVKQHLSMSEFAKEAEYLGVDEPLQELMKASQFMANNDRLTDWITGEADRPKSSLPNDLLKSDKP